MKTIKELRTAQKLSQAEFAKTIGVSTQSVGAYEAGRTKPGEKVLAKIKEVYGEAVVARKEEAKPAEKAAVKKNAAKTAAKKTAEKPAKKAAGKKTEVIIQSPLGGIITPEEIIARIGEADQIYVRVDENKAYWVRGEESGSVDLW